MQHLEIQKSLQKKITQLENEKENVKSGNRYTKYFTFGYILRGWAAKTLVEEGRGGERKEGGS